MVSADVRPNLNYSTDAFPDVIFKNQAMNQETPGQGNFVNDLLRTKFHKFVDIFLYEPTNYTDFRRLGDLWQNLSRHVHHYSTSFTYLILL